MTEELDWKDKDISIRTKEDFLNGFKFDEVCDMQRWFYLTYKKIEELEARIKQLEDK